MKDISLLFSTENTLSGTTKDTKFFMRNTFWPCDQANHKERYDLSLAADH